MRRRYSMPPYWRGGVPVERGQAPSTVTWTSTREKTDQPEVFASWISQLEAAVAYLGLSLTTRDTLEGTEYLAAGRRVAIVQRRKDGGIVGWLLAMPQSDVVGKMEAEGLRRSSQWLGLHGYGQEFVLHLTPEQKAARIAQSTLVVPYPGLVLDLQPHEEEIAALEAKSKSSSIGGGVLAALGVAGGIATALGRKKIGTAGTIAAGVGAAGAGAGGVTLLIKGKGWKDEAKRLRAIQSGTYRGGGAPDDGNLLTDMDTEYYQSKPREHQSIAAELQVVAKSGNPEYLQKLAWSQFDPGDAKLCVLSLPGGAEAWNPADSQAMRDLVARGCADWRAGTVVADSIPDGRQRLMAEQVLKLTQGHRDDYAWLMANMVGLMPRELTSFGRVQGLSFYNVPAGAQWVYVEYIRATDMVVTVRSPGGDRTSTGHISVVVVYGKRNIADQTVPICVIHHHRYGGDNKAAGWFRGNFDNSQRGCGGCLSNIHKTDPKNKMPWIVWKNGFDTMFDGHPPTGFLIPVTSSWFDGVNNGGGGLESPIAAQLDGATNDSGIEIDEDFAVSGVEKSIRFPMGAVTQAYRMLRSTNPEVSSMFFPTVEDIWHLVCGASVVEDHRAWWYSVGDYVGTILGVAQLVTEVATPIISCINPAVGATFGKAMSTAISLGQGVSEIAEGRAGGVLDIMSTLGLTTTMLQSKLSEGYGKVSDLMGNVEEMVTGWADMKGLFIQGIPELADTLGVPMTDVMNPAELFKVMTTQVYSGASSNLAAKVNLSAKTPFWAKKLIAYSNVPKALGTGTFPTLDVWEAYRQ